MIGAFNSIFGGIVAAVIFLFRGMNAWVGMAAISLLTALLMLVVFRITSNQEGIRTVKARIQAHLLELRLFKDDLRTTFASQGRILSLLPKYVGYSSVPVLVMIVPLVLAIVHADLWFGYASLKPGETVLVRLLLREGVKPTSLEIAAEAPPGLAVDSPPLRIDSAGEVDWRLRADADGIHDLVIRVGAERVTKQVAVGGHSLERISPARVRDGVLDELLNPGERAIGSSSAIRRIEIAYPASRMSLFGWHVHWLVAYFVLSMAFGYALKGFFKVEV